MRIYLCSRTFILVFISGTIVFTFMIPGKLVILPSGIFPLHGKVAQSLAPTQLLSILFKLKYILFKIRSHSE